MPYALRKKYLANHVARQDDPVDRFVAAFAWPGAIEFDDIFDDVYPHHPNRHYGNTELWLMKVAARITGGQVTAARTADRAAWAPASEAFYDSFGLRIPKEPPGPTVVDRLTQRLAADADAVRELGKRYMELAVGQVKTYGMYDPDAPYDFAHPDEHLMVLGDGMIWDEYSRITYDGVGQLGRWGYQHTQASREQLVRYQAMRRNPRTRDHAGAQGINFVSLYAWTAYGVVPFGTMPALGPEVHTAQEFVGGLHALLGSGFRFLDYDRVFNGWRRTRLMALFGIDVLNREYADSNPTNTEAHEWLEREARTLADRAGLPVSRDILPALKRATARRLIEHEAVLPLGINLYLTGDGYEAINGKTAYYGTVRPAERDHDCNADLHADNGALWVVEGDLKTARCLPVRSTAEPTGDGTYTQNTEWAVPCEHGGFRHHSVWYPPQRSLRKKTARSDQQRALDIVRVPSRRDPGYGVAGLRNIAESVNERVEQTTQHHGRAATYNGLMQILDMLSYCQLVASETAQSSPDAYRR